MSSALGKWAVLIGGTAIVFAVSVAVGLQLVPGPHSETDYLVIGCIATLLSLSLLFLVLIRTWVKAPDVFFKRRTKTDGDDGDQPTTPA